MKAKWIHISGIFTPGITGVSTPVGDQYYECSNCWYVIRWGVDYPKPLEERCPNCDAEMENAHDVLYEYYSTLPEWVDLKAAMKHDAEIVMIFFGGNPDRIKAIEDAGNRVAKEKGWGYV